VKIGSTTVGAHLIDDGYIQYEIIIYSVEIGIYSNSGVFEVFWWGIIIRASERGIKEVMSIPLFQWARHVQVPIECKTRTAKAAVAVSLRQGCPRREAGGGR
jgi:hypothetical protein